MSLEALVEFSVGDQLEGERAAAFDAVVVGGEGSGRFLARPSRALRTRIPRLERFPDAVGRKARLVDGARAEREELVVADALEPAAERVPDEDAPVCA
jgi:hypothetical protein